jgi:hypothetical protein
MVLYLNVNNELKQFKGKKLNEIKRMPFITMDNKYQVSLLSVLHYRQLLLAMKSTKIKELRGYINTNNVVLSLVNNDYTRYTLNRVVR